MITGVETAGELLPTVESPFADHNASSILGLILAALPLVISALEHYNEGAKPLKNFVRYKAMIRDLVCDLGTQRILFRNTLERLLIGIIDSNVQLALLLDSPGGLGWRDEKLSRRLRQRLQNSFVVYMESVQGINRSLLYLQDQIGLDKEGRVRLSSQSIARWWLSQYSPHGLTRNPTKSHGRNLLSVWPRKSMKLRLRS